MTTLSRADSHSRQWHGRLATWAARQRETLRRRKTLGSFWSFARPNSTFRDLTYPGFACSGYGRALNMPTQRRRRSDVLPPGISTPLRTPTFRPCCDQRRRREPLSDLVASSLQRCRQPGREHLPGAADRPHRAVRGTGPRSASSHQKTPGKMGHRISRLHRRAGKYIAWAWLPFRRFCHCLYAVHRASIPWVKTGASTPDWRPSRSGRPWSVAD